ncbi:hypothetical protein, partial [Pseudomonas fluorescens]|uniref:hypothetical protein n=1 Tax=Pseudomonas fluorescens TaxID=294 RepID=UPI001F161903
SLLANTVYQPALILNETPLREQARSHKYKTYKRPIMHSEFPTESSYRDHDLAKVAGGLRCPAGSLRSRSRRRADASKASLRRRGI